MRVVVIRVKNFYNGQMNQTIDITDIELAVNFLRAELAIQGEQKTQAVQEAQAASLNALAEVYAGMVYQSQLEIDADKMPEAALTAWLKWYETTTDAPCIAICSTTQGDAVCKGCGRTFEEVQRWVEMTPMEKRQIWRRITLDGTAWRFNRYKDRARE